jgi:hypothetical protein
LQDDSVTRGKLGKDTAGSLDTKGERANIDENDFLSVDFAGKNTT